MAFRSDWPVVPPDVLRRLHCALARQSREDRPAGGWQAQAAVSVDRALSHHTIDTARTGFGEKERGSVRVDRRANLVVLSRDILFAPPEAFPRTKMLLTLLEGKPVWRDPSLE